MNIHEFWKAVLVQDENETSSLSITGDIDSLFGIVCLNEKHV